jgi:hypothetical protein
VKAVAFSELLLLMAILAVAWFVYVQQEQLVALELELDRLRGSFQPPVLPMEGNSANSEAKLPPTPKRAPRKPKAAG